jgi:predicted dehydrogenase
MGKTVRLGLVGLGKHGRRYLDPRNGGLHVMSGCGRSDSLPEMLSRVDGVIVATPPDTHRDIVLRCLEAGKDVLCEKPLALTWDDCRAMLDAADRAGLRLVVAHQHLWADGFERHMGQQVQHVGTVSGGPSGHDYSPWLDWGSHDVAMTIAAFGVAPEGVERLGLAGATLARLTFSSGTADVLTGVLPAKVRRLEATTAYGVWSYDGTHQPGLEPMRLMVDAFVACEHRWRSSTDFGRAVYGAMFQEKA